VLVAVAVGAGVGGCLDEGVEQDLVGTLLFLLALSVGTGEGDTGGLLRLSFFACLVRSFSSSSEEITSGSFVLSSTLKVLEVAESALECLNEVVLT
jgi:hypothetical protein